jgi:AAA ATPase domain
VTTANSDSGYCGPPATSQTIFAREAEIEELRARFARRRSFLLHGPAGVGKTLLLAAVCPEVPDVLYSASNPTPQALYRNLAAALFAARDQKITKAFPAGVSSLQERKSAVALKGIVREVLRNSKYWVVVDHLARPSQSVAASVRELMVECSVPVLAVSRSAHMEDAGFVLQLFPDRAEQFALRNFDSSTARSFADWCARRESLTAENLAQFLDKVNAYSAGNPGAIEQMIRLAKSPQYSCGGQIKTAPLYIDFKLAMVSQ